ncbi:short transient receptor potential channel 4-associated protein-like [Watersipora subatra]|uniref:short transient receptor potential channel 4-associated protein-like n=1 Tax=Watersipora subatra TaxID=2589382 RepID=UPI00355B24B6
MGGSLPDNKVAPARTKNLVDRVFHTEIHGKSYRFFNQVPPALLEKYEDQIEGAEILEIVCTMDEYLRCESCTIDKLYRSFKALFECVTCFDRRNTEGVVAYKREDWNARLFYELGGIEAAKRIIMLEGVLLPNSVHREESLEQLRMKTVLFEAVGRIVTSDSIGEQVSKELAEDEMFFTHMFSYLNYDQTFFSACSLMEDVLQNRPTLRLSHIPNFKKFLTSLKGDKLMNFFRILSITVSDLDVFENKVSLLAQDKETKGESFINVRDLNQEYLLEIPYLLEQLVAVASSKDYSPRYRGVNGEVENWMQWIDDSNSDELLELPDEDLDVDEFVGGVSQPTDYDAPWCRQPSMAIINELIYKVECLHVLCLLMVGKHRKTAQQVFAEKKLIPALCSIFENFIWNLRGHRTLPSQRLARHNFSCECSPEASIKIQAMRLIHSFCDHSDYKHLLLTRSELAEVQRINEKAGPLAIKGLDKVNKANMCKGKEGLLTKIIEVTKKESPSSNFRFWLTRAVESYLRGATSYCDQVFILRRGLLQHLINNLLEESSRKEILQSGLDLLGELTKFNIEAFKIVEDILRTPEARKKFIDLINENLVDSNMFIRSAILSFGFFCNEQTEHADYAREGNYLLSYMGEFQHRVNYLHQLINLTLVHSVSQGTVSSLNTALVLIMSTCKAGDARQYLQALKEESVTYTEERRGGSMVLSNFRELLIFWKDYFLSKERDSSVLEKSSRIQFSEWKVTVETLLNPDRSLETSLLHYIDDS